MDKKHIENFYDYFNEIATHLYDHYHIGYLEGMNESFAFLLDDAFTKDFNPETMDLAQAQKDLIVDVSFDKEEVRKAVQLGLLKGYKHAYESNALITPDTIGIFIGYLIKKLYANKSLNSIFDPLVGSGNLLYSVANYLERDLSLYGVDMDLVKCNLARNIGDLLDYKNEMFFQDTLTYFDQGFDSIVTDMPLHFDTEQYLPYQVINHHLDSLKEGGFFFAVIENDFFEQEGSAIFRQEINKKASIFGLIKLPESLFKARPKSILIIRKVVEVKQQDFLLVDLPGFNDVKSFNNIINQIDMWIDEREDKLK
jgi:site-specific DNA-methyltransferase (adenine-specific)